jgi:hypothetical protein
MASRSLIDYDRAITDMTAALDGVSIVTATSDPITCRDQNASNGIASKQGRSNAELRCLHLLFPKQFRSSWPNTESNAAAVAKETPATLIVHPDAIELGSDLKSNTASDFRFLLVDNKVRKMSDQLTVECIIRIITLLCVYMQQTGLCLLSIHLRIFCVHLT